METSESLTRRPPEEFRIGQNCKLPLRKGEPARDRAETSLGRGDSGLIPGGGRLSRREGEFAEALTLTLRGTQDNNPPSLALPLGELLEKLPPPRLINDEISGTKGGEGNRIKDWPLIFLLSGFLGLLELQVL